MLQIGVKTFLRHLVRQDFCLKVDVFALIWRPNHSIGCREFLHFVDEGLLKTIRNECRFFIIRNHEPVL